ncbi:MAG: glycosyltransferase [Candidatus Omnitrophica bacterium]|nr:glycosyltransferase [Candidatus Omnitrophota bacterium]
MVYAAHEPDFQPQSDPEKLKAICEREADGFNYFLHFSTGDPRDNTPVVLEAYQRARRQFKKEMKLVIVGCPKTRYAQAQEVSQSGIMYHDFAIGTKLLELYQGALAYVDPSLFEGFGFQPLEAMACGVPVVASNVTSIPEIVGEAGILLAPQDVEGFRDAMIQMANNPSLGEHMREQSIRRARLFNWETTARQIESCFEKALTYARRN